MKQLFILLLIISFTTSCHGKAIIFSDVKDLNFVVNQIQKDNPAAESTLVILDIDDTLLESVNFVGSVKWYNWQRGKTVTNHEGRPFTIEEQEKYACIFGTLGTLFELGTTRLTQQDAAQLVNELKAYDLMILTARTTDFRGPTERELIVNGIEINDEHLMKESHGLAFDLEDNGRTAEVTYHNGIVLSSGLNKGLVLKSILERVGKSYSHIYFVDDSQKNIDNMNSFWGQDQEGDQVGKSNLMLKLFHYTKVDKSISQQEVKQSNQVKQLFDQLLSTAYPDRAMTFASNKCR